MQPSEGSTVVAEVLAALAYGELRGAERAKDSVRLAPDARSRTEQAHVANLEVANQAEMAILVEAGNPRALYQAMLRGVHDAGLRTQLGRNARLLFESRYTEDRMLNSYRRLYLELVESTSAAAVAVSKTRPARMARIS